MVLSNAGEEDGQGGEVNGLMSYWKNLAVVLFGCLCLFVFDMCERGVQLQVAQSSLLSVLDDALIAEPLLLHLGDRHWNQPRPRLHHPRGHLRRPLLHLPLLHDQEGLPHDLQQGDQLPAHG